MSIVLYAFNRISDGLAGSQRTLVGSLMWFLYMRIYDPGHPCVPHMPSNCAPLRRHCMTIVLYAFNCISDGLAGSQRTLVGSLMGLVRYPYMRIYVPGHPCVPHMLSN